jgi:hypothetical protein
VRPSACVSETRSFLRFYSHCAAAQVLKSAVHTQTPSTELVPPCCPQWKFRENLLFVTEKQPTLIAIGWSEPVCGWEFHSSKSSAFHCALLRQLAFPTLLSKLCE